MFNPFHPLLIPPQPCVPTFFGKYSTAFQVAANQSAIEDLKKNDLQIGIGAADNTGSKVEFNSMVHSMGLVNLTLGSKTVPSTRVFKPGSTSEKLFDRAPTTSITATSNFSASISSKSTSSYKKSTGIYLLVGKPSTTVTFTGNSSEKYTWNATYTFSKNTGNVKTVTPSREYDNAGWGFDYTGAVQTFNTPKTGTYKVECWGAQGGGGNGYSGGKGGYTSGQINLSSNKNLYVYVGQQGESFDSKNVTLSTWSLKGESWPDCGASNVIVYNNGGYAVEIYGFWNYPGGGSTDVRVISGNWYDFNSLKSRIMVAASGGGAQLYNSQLNGIDAGSTVGKNGTQSGSDGNIALAGTQTAKGQDGTGSWMGSNSNQGFGKVQYVKTSMGGSGNGYYCGGLGNHGEGTTGPGATGSSFISGHSGCNAISVSSTESNIIHTGQANHYSGYVFTNTVMKAGNESMPSPSGGTETGHSGNGYAIITQVSY